MQRMHTAIHRCGQYIREQAKPGWRQSLLLCCTFMAQLGGASAARGEPAAAAHGAPVSGALDCKGLRPSDVRARETAGFLHMCRVIDSGFSRVSAEILLDLRARARDVVAVQTFEAICARGGPNVASLFDQALRLRSSGHRVYLCDVLIADRPLAAALVAAADRVNAASGGLYMGKVDCLRSTLCNPALGLAAASGRLRRPGFCASGSRPK